MAKVNKSVMRGVPGGGKKDGVGVPVGSHNSAFINQRVYKDHKMSDEPKGDGTQKPVFPDVNMKRRPRSVINSVGGTPRTRG